MKIHHTGIAVKEINKCVSIYETLGYVCEGDIIADEARNINILFMTNGENRIELIEKLQRNKQSPIDSILVGNVTHQIYHTCYSVEDISMAVDKLTKNRFIVTIQPAEAIAFNNKKVCFLYSRNVGMIELCEE